MAKLAIIGASGHGKVLADIAELTGWEEIDFYDDFYYFFIISTGLLMYPKAHNRYHII